MKDAITTGLLCEKGRMSLKPREITVRAETTGKFSSLSLSDDAKGTMIEIAVTPEVKRILKGVCD